MLDTAKELKLVPAIVIGAPFVAMAGAMLKICGMAGATNSHLPALPAL